MQIVEKENVMYEGHVVTKKGNGHFLSLPHSPLFCPVIWEGDYPSIIERRKLKKKKKEAENITAKKEKGGRRRKAQEK